MKSILTITVPATSQDLTTVATVKAELGITGTDSDDRLATLIDQASGIVAEYCGRSFGEETLTETFRLGFSGFSAHGFSSSIPILYSGGDSAPVGGPLILSRRPVSSVKSVEETGELLVAADYELDPDPGMLYRMSGDQWSMWRGGKIVVVYIAGYALVDSLPQGIERACIELVKSYWSAGSRDPALRRLSITTPGVETIDQEFWINQAGVPAMPREVIDLLATHRAISF